MKSLQILIMFSLIFLSCQPMEKTNQKNNEVQKDTLQKPSENKQSLVLTSDALQLVDQITGSTNDLPFGTPENQLMDIINNTLQTKPLSNVVNAECGAGPLKMVTWNNGLTLVFQENNTKSADPKTDWLFQGLVCKRH